MMTGRRPLDDISAFQSACCIPQDIGHGCVTAVYSLSAQDSRLNETGRDWLGEVGGKEEQQFSSGVHGTGSQSRRLLKINSRQAFVEKH